MNADFNDKISCFFSWNISSFFFEWSSTVQFDVLTSVLWGKAGSLIGRSDSFPFTYGNFSLGTHRQTQWHTCTTPTIPGGQLPNEANAWQVRARLWLCIRLWLPLKPQSPGEFPQVKELFKMQEGKFTLKL